MEKQNKNHDLREYLKSNFENGIIDHALRANVDGDGRVTFYIHANGYDSDTLDFELTNFMLIPIHNTSPSKAYEVEQDPHIKARLDNCVKDEHGQPLICYGCSHSAAYCTYTDGKLVPGTDFPGRPSGERPCCFCKRNPERKDGQEIVEYWYDLSEPLNVPMDCYHSVDMLMQINKWTDEKEVKESSEDKNNELD